MGHRKRRYGNTENYYIIKRWILWCVTGLQKDASDIRGIKTLSCYQPGGKSIKKHLDIYSIYLGFVYKYKSIIQFLILFSSPLA